MKITWIKMSIWAMVVFYPIASHGGNFKLDGYFSTSPFQSHKGLMFIQATVNDKKGWFLFDTGAEDLILNKERFPELKSALEEGQLINIKDKRNPLETVQIKHFRWEKLSRRNFRTGISNLQELENILNMELLGLIGFQVYAKFGLMIDHPAELITVFKLDKQGAPPNWAATTTPDQTIPFSLSDHFMMLQVKVGRKAPLQLAIDSGSTLCVLDNQLKKKLYPYAQNFQKVTFTGVSTSINKADYFGFGELTIADKVKITDWGAGFISLAHLREDHPTMDGLLGGNIFEGWKTIINFKSKEIHFWKGNKEILSDNETW